MEQTHSAPIPAFYHWKTQLHLSQHEQHYLEAIGGKKLYAKFFDVDWDETTAQPMPLATIELDSALLGNFEIVPTIFITNRTLVNLPIQQMDSLAGLIFYKIKSLALRPFYEAQFDCDWTKQTQAKFFALLERFKDKAPRTALSATIRLHQLKYFEKTGVPPVDRGMLMCYNMGDLDDWATENSILDIEVAKNYLPKNSGAAYPIPLDFALPLFRWGVLFRDGRMIKLLNDLNAANLEDTSRFKKTANNRYEVLKSTYLNAHYLYAGDQLRLEGVSEEDLLKVATLLGKWRNDTSLTVAFYHLDSTAISLFPKEKITEVLQRF